MMTFSPSSPIPSEHITSLRQLWLVALVEAAVGALTTLLLGADGIDPAAGVRL